MSLINEMLRNLEERRAGELARQDLQREIRPLPPRRGSKAGLGIAVAVAAIGAVAAGGWLAYERWPTAHPSTPSAAPAPAIAAFPPATPVALPADAMLPREGVGSTGTDGLRMTLSLQTVPAEPPAAPEAAAAVPPLPAAEKPVTPAGPGMRTPKEGAAPLQAAAAKAPAVAALEPAASPASIEKSASLATPRERAEADYRKALAAAAAGRTGEAIEVLQAALRQDANHLPARQGLVRALIEGRRGEEAEAVLRDGVDLQPAQIGWAMALARLQVERNDLPGALRTLGRSAPHATRSADYQGFFGHVEYRLGHYREAAALYQAATRLAPGEGRWWLGLGLALEGEGQGGEAREAFRKALATGNLNGDLAAIAEQKGR